MTPETAPFKNISSGELFFVALVTEYTAQPTIALTLRLYIHIWPIIYIYIVMTFKGYMYPHKN